MKLVRENIEFKRGIEPAKAMNIGYGNKMKTKFWKALEFIRSKGEEGASTKEIQEYIYFEINKAPLGKDWFEEKDKGRWNYKTNEYDPNKIGSRRSRGYWNSTFYSYDDRRGGGRLKKKGLLDYYCHKNEKGKWVLDRMPKQGENIMYENIEFERGLEPSKAMNIGKDRKIKEGDKFYADYQFNDRSKAYHILKGMKEVIATENERVMVPEVRTLILRIKELPGHTWCAEFKEGKWVIE